MPEFYAEHNLRRHFTAPQFTRSRHRFRGARESEKVNLEMDQLYYSIHKLYDIQNQFQDHFVQRANLLLEGGSIEVESNEDGPIDVVGLEELVARVDMLRRRVKALEA